VTPDRLLPFPLSPLDDPIGWQAALRHGGSPIAPVSPWPEPGTRAARLLLVPELRRLAAAGIRPFGYVSLGHGTRPRAEVVAEIQGWAQLPVLGVLVDHAPPGPFLIGTALHAVRAAHEAGLRRVVVNPATEVDPGYHRLDATICTFQGTWPQYLSAEVNRGDGHLIYAVPPPEQPIARALATARGAGLVLVTDRPVPATDQALASSALTLGS
jgi:hypothetical protein